MASGEKDLILADYVEPGIKWGYINTEGALVIKERLDDCSDFAGGRAAASLNGLWGYIDQQGEWTIKPQYKGAWSFKNNRGRVRILDGYYGYINFHGKLVIPADWEEAEDFIEYRAKVKINNRYQYIDTIGKFISDDSWDQAFAFNQSFARVSNGGWWGLINYTGKMVVRPSYDELGVLANNRLPVATKGHWGYVDTLGTIKVPLKYEYACAFQHSTGVVKDGAKWYWIDTVGKILKETTADLVYDLGYSLWAVMKNDVLAVFNNQGLQLTEFEFDQLNKFSDGLAVFSKEGTFGYLDSLAKVVIPNKFLLAWDFKNGYARYTVGSGIGFINKEGKGIHEFTFPDVRDFHEGMAKVQTVHR